MNIATITDAQIEAAVAAKPARDAAHRLVAAAPSMALLRQRLAAASR